MREIICNLALEFLALVLRRLEAWGGEWGLTGEVGSESADRLQVEAVVVVLAQVPEAGPGAPGNAQSG
jgi:hypothetical protein